MHGGPVQEGAIGELFHVTSDAVLILEAGRAVASDPGAANWGQMMNENRLGLATQPWSVMAPVLMIAIFTIGTNLMADGLAQVTQRGSD